MKRSVLTALVLPSVIAVTLGGTALSAPTASAAPAPSSASAAAPDDGGAVTDPTAAPVPDAAAPTPDATPAEATPGTTPAPVGPAPAEATPVEATPVEATPVEAPAGPAPVEAPAEPATDDAPVSDDAADIAAATEPGTVAISGTTGIDDVQTAVTEGWPEGTTFTYQWTRDGAAVEGATAETYVLVPADAGRVVEVAVTGTGPGVDDEPTTVTSERGTAAGAVPAFTAQPGTSLTVVAGEPYSFTWEASGDPAPYVAIVADPRTLVSTLPVGATETHAPGSVTIAGTSTYAESTSFGVTPINEAGYGQLLVVDLQVVPAAAASIFVTAATTSGTGEPTFVGAVASSLDGSILPVSLDDGQSVLLAAYAGDAFGNAVPREALPAGLDVPVFTSSGDADEAVVLDTGFSGFTVHGPGTRVVTASLAGFTASFPVEVRSTAVVVPVASGSGPASTADSLAYTGAESTSGLLAVAAGLLAAGTALTVVRLRRRAQR